ncbi:TPA: hypothetical protein OTT35_000048 [Citrobacter koseri]|nr:hypothetical protein [Citrobacter koseri]
MSIHNYVYIDRELMVVALQALHRERLNSYNSACTACSLTGKELPQQEKFGIEEVNNALLLFGVAPVR